MGPTTKAKDREDACRAEIPAMLSPDARGALLYTSRCRQRWGQREGERVTSPLLGWGEIEEFLAEFAMQKETEVAHQCLFDSGFDVPRAVALLHVARREKLKAKRDEAKRLSADAFGSAITTHGKKFHLVQQKLGPDVITREVVSKFYLWKRTTKFKRWRQQQKSKKKKESASLRLWGGESDAGPDALAGYHNEHCELCSTGGKLLCCDGCARAYHFSCVQPPITDVPEDDWFCPRCRGKMGDATPKLIPSEENEYCMVYAPVSVENCPDEPHEAISDASSYEAEGGRDGVDGDEGVGEGGDASNELPAGSEQDDGSDYPSTEELSSSVGNSGSLTDNDESDGSGAKFLSLSPDHSDQTPVRRPKQQRAEVATHSGGSYLSSTKRSLEYSSSVPSPSGGRRMAPLQQERLPSSRKRQRKTAPRRIPPSHFDN